MEPPLSWIWRKLDMFAGAIVIASLGMIASQGQAFFFQYLQRLGGHIDEARAHLENVQTGSRYMAMDESIRMELEADAAFRVSDLQNAYSMILDANIFTRPFVFARHADPTIIAGTWTDFVPAIPLDSASLIYVFMGMSLGFALYEFLKLAALAFRHGSQRRRFRHR